MNPRKQPHCPRMDSFCHEKTMSIDRQFTGKGFGFQLYGMLTLLKIKKEKNAYLLNYYIDFKDSSSVLISFQLLSYFPYHPVHQCYLVLHLINKHISKRFILML